MNPRKPLMAGNWKMYKTTGETVAFMESLTSKLAGISELPEVVLAPPFTALAAACEAVLRLKSPVQVAAQTMESREEGAFTGEIAPRMLEDLGVPTVIIGHSERRQYYNETDATVNAKAHAALRHHLTPILCVGETLAEREAGQTDAVVIRQVQAALEGIQPVDYPKLVFAYEPVWAIGTGKVCDAQEANRVCGVIRQVFDGQETRILYGGSVKPENSAELMAQPDIDGALVGGASLEVESFFNIVQAAVSPVVGSVAGRA